MCVYLWCLGWVVIDDLDGFDVGEGVGLEVVV